MYFYYFNVLLCGSQGVLVANKYKMQSDVVIIGLYYQQWLVYQMLTAFRC